MPNPYTARVRSQAPPPRRAPSSPPITRLQRLGADDAVLAEVQRRWARLTDSEKTDAYRDLNNLTDDELREQIAETQTSEVVPQGSVGDVLAWVGDNRIRAIAALREERAKPVEERRVTLVDPLTAMVDG